MVYVISFGMHRIISYNPKHFDLASQRSGKNAYQDLHLTGKETEAQRGQQSIPKTQPDPKPSALTSRQCFIAHLPTHCHKYFGRACLPFVDEPSLFWPHCFFHWFLLLISGFHLRHEISPLSFSPVAHCPYLLLSDRIGSLGFLSATLEELQWLSEPCWLGESLLKTQSTSLSQYHSPELRMHASVHQQTPGRTSEHRFSQETKIPQDPRESVCPSLQKKPPTNLEGNTRDQTS